MLTHFHDDAATVIPTDANNQRLGAVQVQIEGRNFVFELLLD